MRKIISLLVIMIVCLFPMTFAAPGGGATTKVGSQRGSDTAGTSIDIVGGNVTGVNVTTTSITGRWAGFFGNITGGIALGDGTSSFYEWTVSDVTDSVVYVSNGTVSNWGLVAASAGDMPSYINTAAADNYSNTFTATENFNSSSITNIASTPYTQTWSSGSQGSLKTYSLKDADDSDLVWAGKAINDDTGFNGETVDYQVLVPADAAVVTYTFYLELP